MGILRDISEIKDEKILEITSKISGLIEDLDVRLSKYGIDSECGKLIKPKAAFIGKIVREDSINSEEYTIDLSAVVSALDSDSRRLTDLISNNIEAQLHRQEATIQKIRKKFKVYPNELDKTEILSDITSCHMNFQNYLSSGHYADGKIESLKERFDALIETYERKMKDLWAKIQELEKYHNDNERYKFARSAILISSISLILSVFTILFQQYIFWSEDKPVSYEFNLIRLTDKSFR